jgi:prevent-host-death family protein
MTEVGVREARGRLSELLNEVASGGEVKIVRRGKEIARLVPPPKPKPGRFPSRRALRDSIKLKGEPMSKTILRMREEARY